MSATLCPGPLQTNTIGLLFCETQFIIVSTSSTPAGPPPTTGPAASGYGGSSSPPTGSSTPVIGTSSTSGSEPLTSNSMIQSSGASTSQTSSATTTQSVASVHSSASVSAKSSDNSTAIVGTAVGCIFGGLLVGVAIGYLVFRWRTKRTNRHATPANYSRAPTETSSGGFGSDKGATATVAGLSAGAAGAAAIAGLDFLPQQADDQQVGTRLKTIFDQISLHVENFYAEIPVQLTSELEGELSRFESGQLSQPLAACFERAQYPTILIKHCLAFNIANLTVAPGKDADLILPPSLNSVVGSVYSRTLRQDASREQIFAFATWKRLTAFLVPSPGAGKISRGQSSSTMERSSGLARHFTAAFAPWCNNNYPEQERVNSLVGIIEEASRTAVFLFSQPETYKFSWAGRSREAVTVVPSVVKTTHNGHSLGTRGQQIVESEQRAM